MIDIVIAGKNNIAIDVLEFLLKNNLVKNVFAIFNSTDNGVDNFQRSFKKYCEREKIKSITLEEAENLEDVIFLSLEFDKIINPRKFKTDKIYNIHFSLLPKYKGMYTSAWPVLNCESETGVTLHEIDAGIDTGNIIKQASIPIEDNDTAQDLYIKYIAKGTELVISNIHNIIRGDFVSYKQESENSSYFSKESIDYRCIEINLNNTAYKIKKAIQAFTFRYYQIVNILGYDIRGAKILDKKSFKKPGEILLNSDKYLEISTVDYDLRLYKDKFKLLLSACEIGDFKLFEDTINEYNFNDKNELGWSPIIVASYNGHFEIVKALLELGANVNDVNNNGTSVLMYAKDFSLKSNSLELFKFLISKGALLEAKDFNNKELKDYLTEEQKCFFNFIV